MGIVKLIHKIEENVAKLLLALIIGLVFFAALFRWIGYPIVWSVDIAQLLFGWVVFLGADMALRNNNHIGIDVVVNRFPQNIQRGIMLFHYSLIIVFLSTIAVYGFYLSVINFERTFNTIGISYSYATVSVPVGCILMLGTIGSKITSLLKQRSIDADAEKLPQRSEVFK